MDYLLLIHTIVGVGTLLLVVFLRSSLGQFENCVSTKLDAQTRALANLTEWMGMWHHERLTGDAKRVVGDRMLTTAKDLRACVEAETKVGS